MIFKGQRHKYVTPQFVFSCVKMDFLFTFYDEIYAIQPS